MSRSLVALYKGLEARLFAEHLWRSHIFLRPVIPTEHSKSVSHTGRAIFFSIPTSHQVELSAWGKSQSYHSSISFTKFCGIVQFLYVQEAVLWWIRPLTHLSQYCWLSLATAVPSLRQRTSYHHLSSSPFNWRCQRLAGTFYMQSSASSTDPQPFYMPWVRRTDI